jgi:hypothetical protein
MYPIFLAGRLDTRIGRHANLHKLGASCGPSALSRRAEEGVEGDPAPAENLTCPAARHGGSFRDYPALRRRNLQSLVEALSLSSEAGFFSAHHLQISAAYPLPTSHWRPLDDSNPRTSTSTMSSSSARKSSSSAELTGAGMYRLHKPSGRRLIEWQRNWRM